MSQIKKMDSSLAWDQLSSDPESLNNLCRVAVVGDLMLDEYLDGTVERISPEAPVMVQKVGQVSHAAGGAANAARNIVTLGGAASIYGVCGEDEAGDLLRRLLEQDQIDSFGLVLCGDRPTVKKTRVRALNQQLIRIDWEENKSIAEQVAEQMFKKLAGSNFDAILLSDYGKGCLSTPLIKRLTGLAHQHGKPILVDPKGKDFSRYTGCDLITPNYKEACEALGLSSGEVHAPELLCEQLIQRYGLRRVLVTLGKDGMICAQKLSGEIQFARIASDARQVFDVSGAGDTVAAAMSLGMAAGQDIVDAMKVASLAAGVAVEKLGTSPVYKEELLGELDCQLSTPASTATSSKIIQQPELEERLSDWRINHKKVVFTNGCFDLLHAGHVMYLEQAKNQGDVLVLGLNTDESIAKLKGNHRPILPLEQRSRILAALSAVDVVVAFSELTPLRLIKLICPDVLVKAEDYLETEIVGAEFVVKNGGRIFRAPLQQGISTSTIEQKIIQSFKKQLAADGRPGREKESLL